MNLFDLPTAVPWLSLSWLSLLAPALAIMLMPPGRTGAIRAVGLGGAAVALALTLLVFGAYDPGGARFQFIERVPWLPQLGISYSLGVDGISLAMLLLNAVIVLCAALISWSVTDRAREYWALLLLLGAGAHGVFVSLDLLLLFVFYELTLLPKFLLITLWGSTRKEYGAMKLALYLMGGSALLLLGIVALFFGGTIRTFDMPSLAQTALLSRPFQVAFFPLLFIGFGVLAAVFPLHTWVPTGHVAAPTAGSMLLAGVMMKLGSYGCLRVAMWLMPEGASAWLLPIAVAAVVGTLYGATVTLVQRDFKFLIAYSSVSHMGLVIVGLAAGNAIGMTGAVLQMFAHGLMSALLFAVVGRMVYERTHTRQLAELGGLAGALPFAAGVFVVGALASLGMPGTASFWAEMSVLLGMWQRYPLVAVLAALSIPITATYMLRAAYQVFFGEARASAGGVAPLTWPEYAAGAILAALILVTGLFPGYLTEPVGRSVAPIAEALGQAAALGLGR